MKRQSLLAVTVLGALALSGCTGPSGSDAGTGPASSPPAPGEPAAESTRLETIQETGILKVCSTGDYRPFTYVDPESDEWTGIDIAMVEDLASRMDVEVEYVDTTWKNLMPDFLGKCDVAVGGISISMERAAQAYYTAPVLNDGKTPITLCENVAKYDTVEEINRPGVRSITPIGGTNEKFAEEHYPEGDLLRFEDNNTIFDEIIAGRADVMTTDAAETRWVANRHPELCAVHPDDPFNFSQKAYLLPRGDEVFQEYVDEWLNMAIHDGTYDVAKKPWFG